ncbi:MAG: family 78 glycoside hydrolase catalytic domain [Clostridia bacterium]|nr:family 78 glycoside hydrolase catalytic domain [Clostridia bacterium]
MNDFIKEAKFISGEAEWKLICPKFRKEFTFTKAIKSAELQISALGVYEAKINGQRVGDLVMMPGWTEYAHRLQYQSYDVTEMLSESNVIEIGAGHGWYASRMGTPKTTNGFYGDVPSVIAALKVVFTDGSEELIVTDETWKAATSEVLQSQIYDGETMDARIVPQFDTNVRIFDYDKEKLIPTESEDIRVTEKIAVKKVIVTPKGEIVLDFGQNLTGYLEFTVCGSAGHTVKLYHGEVLDKDGNFYNENYRSAKALTTYTLKDGVQSYGAIYTFYGFRYVKLENWPEEVKAENFTACVVHSDMKRTGWFKCGHAKINKLFENIIYGQRGNFLDVPTDCPQRDERLGWTGDAEVFCKTAVKNYDAERFFAKWLRDMKLAQREDGMIPRIIPNILPSPNESSSSAWGDAATVCPWEIYVAYGNKELLAEFYGMMEKWVNYVHAKPGGYLWKDSFHFGDWLGIDAPAGSYRGATSEELIGSAYFYLSTTLLIKAGKVLGYDMTKYEELKENIKKAYLAEYLKDGRLTSDTQTAYVVTIHFGLCGCDAELKKAMGDRLIELIEEAGDSLRTGFVGTPYLLDTLTEIGRPDKAYTLLLREKFPSWLFSVNMGATTIWEHWDGLREDGSFWSKDMNSFNHYAYGSVASWMYGTAAGIKSDENAPAYKHFFISPIPDKRLGSAKAKLDTRSGSIMSEWYCEGDDVRYSFVIPEGTTATVTIDGKTEELSAGKYTRWGTLA